MKIILACVLALIFTVPISAVTLDTVPIGNPGNPADGTQLNTPIGSVPYSFRIGKFEVTNAQYQEFLNAVARTDVLELYDANMGNSNTGGITRSGTAGIFAYSLKPGMANKPVVFVSWFSAIRFANWLHNGQGGPGTTEYGAYTLNGGSAIPDNPESIVRNPGARWWLTSWDEWYKAAYYDPVTQTYFLLPTGSNSPPTPEPPPGGVNSANFWPSAASADLTDVGAYLLSDSPYGTFDQGGNVWEWTDQLIGGMYRGMRGGSKHTYAADLFKTHFAYGLPAYGTDDRGFRVATVIPEPSTLLSAVAVALLLLLCHRCTGRNYATR